MKNIELLELLKFCRANEFVIMLDGSQMGIIKRNEESISFYPENLLSIKEYITEIDISDNKVIVYIETSDELPFP